MKRYITFLLLQFFTIYSYGQKPEFNFNIYSGLFSYIGKGSTSTSTINYGINILTPYTTNVYGNKLSIPIGFEVQILKNIKSNLLYGIGFSYDLLKSRVNINKAQFNPEVVVSGQSYLYDADGHSNLKNTYMNINPFLGKRFLINKMFFDFLGGIDIGICLKSLEQGHATIVSPKADINSSLNKSYPTIDFRPRIQLKAGYKRTGVLIGYSLGITNYQNHMTSKAVTNFIRFGICYRIR
jgi:hypothetical protein